MLRLARALIGTLAMTAAAILIEGCTVTVHTSPATSDTPTPPPRSASAPAVADTPKPVDADAQFTIMLPDIAGETPAAAEWRDLRKLGHATCTMIDNGGTMEDMADLLVSEGIDPESRTGRLAMAAMVVATETYCPEHSGFFNR